MRANLTRQIRRTGNFSKIMEDTLAAEFCLAGRAVIISSLRRLPRTKSTSTILKDSSGLQHTHLSPPFPNDLHANRQVLTCLSINFSSPTRHTHGRMTGCIQGTSIAHYADSQLDLIHHALGYRSGIRMLARHCRCCWVKCLVVCSSKLKDMSMCLCSHSCAVIFLGQRYPRRASLPLLGWSD